MQEAYRLAVLGEVSSMVAYQRSRTGWIAAGVSQDRIVEARGMIRVAALESRATAAGNSSRTLSRRFAFT